MSDRQARPLPVYILTWDSNWSLYSNLGGKKPASKSIPTSLPTSIQTTISDHDKGYEGHLSYGIRRRKLLSRGRFEISVK